MILSKISSILKKSIAYISLSLVLIMILFLFSAKYEDKISNRLNLNLTMSHFIIEPLSHFFPEIFYKHNKKKVWHPSNTRHTSIIFAYTDKHSIFPGQTFNIMLSTAPETKSISGNLEIYRIGYYGDTDRKLVWNSDSITVNHQLTHDSAASVGLMWNPIEKTIDTSTWDSGYYDIDFISENEKKYPHIASIVVKNKSSQLRDILLKITTNTYQAYNFWGGHNLYGSSFLGKGQRGYAVSFDRPLIPFAFHDFYRWEYYLVMWIEELAQKFNFTVDYTTNFDMSLSHNNSPNYSLLISAGHDEYWSKEEFDNTYKRIFSHGKNTMFLGANTAYWQIRYSDVNSIKSSEFQGRQMISYKSLQDPIKYRVENDSIDYVTARFRDDSRRPETMLMGSAYQWFSKGKQNLFVENTNFPFFKNTAYKNNELVGNIIGHEWDNRDPNGDKKRLFHSKKSNIAEIPLENIHVLFSGVTTGKGGKKGIAETVYFESKAGAKVFSSGTNNWVKGLTMDGEKGDKFRKFNQNLILDFLNKTY